MKQFLIHFKLVMLDSFSIVIVFICGLEILFTNIVSLKLDPTYVLLGIIPVILTMMLTILDVFAISCYNDLRAEDFDTYRLVPSAEKTKPIKVMRNTMKVIKFIAVLAIITSIVIGLYALALSLTTAIVAYVILLFLAASHFYAVTRKI